MWKYVSLIMCFVLTMVAPCSAYEVCMDESTAQGIVMQLDACQVDRDVLQAQDKIIAEQKQQISIANSVAESLTNQVQADAEIIKSKDKEMEDLKALHKEEIKAAEPTWGDRTGWAGAGAVVALLLALALL